MAAITVNGVTYGKPNMASLEGELGRRVFRTITTTPRPDFRALDEKCAEVSARMSEARANGTF